MELASVISGFCCSSAILRPSCPPATFRRYDLPIFTGSRRFPLQSSLCETAAAASAWPSPPPKAPSSLHLHAASCPCRLEVVKYFVNPKLLLNRPASFLRQSLSLGLTPSDPPRQLWTQPAASCGEDGRFTARMCLR